MQKINYQLEMERIILSEAGKTPRLLLHCCCAPCTSGVLGRLTAFVVDLFFFNPNISPAEEHERRLAELWRFADEAGHAGARIAPAYSPEEFFAAAKGLEAAPEGGARCMKCFELRLGRAAEYAAAHGYDYFATTLTVSPHKNADALNAIGGRLGEEYGVKYLCSDFKKKEGYKLSIEMSKKYGLYRQDYCGCMFSK